MLGKLECIKEHIDIQGILGDVGYDFDILADREIRDEIIGLEYESDISSPVVGKSALFKIG